MELNDMGTNVLRDHTGQDFADMIVAQFDELLEDSAHHPVVMSVALHTFVCGQPFRMRPLRQALRHCAEHPQRDRVWYTRAVDIANYCRGLPVGVIAGS
jgi:allantoinase